MRLGELLVHTGAITGDQRDAAIRQQVVYGARLGTNLIELGYASPDAVAHALARLLHVPASLERHFEQHDPQVMELIPRELATSCQAFPIAYAETRVGRRLVCCLRNPTDNRAVQALTEVAPLPLIACVAPELVLFYWLERGYGIRRQSRYRSAHVGTAEPLPREQSDRMPAAAQAEALDEHSIDIDIDVDDEIDMPASLQLVDLDHSDVERDFSHYNAPQNANRESLLDLAVAAAAAVEVADAPKLSAEQAVLAVRNAPTRVEIADAIVAYLRGRFGAGLMVIAKEGMALGHRGCGGNFDDDSVETILIPLSAPSMFRVAFEAKRVCKGPPPSSGKAIQDRFFKLFPGDAPSEVVVMPVVLKDRVVCMIYAHDAAGDSIEAAAVVELETLAREMVAAYTRLIKRAKR